MSSQMRLVKQMENLSVEYESLTTLPRDKFTVEQYLKRLEDYFDIFRKQHEMLLTLSETTDKQAYLKNKVPMAGVDAYYHGKARFKRILSNFQSQTSSVNPAQAPAHGFAFNRTHNLSPDQSSCNRRYHSRLHSLYTSNNIQRVPSQQSSSEKVDGKPASPSRDSSESGRFVAASLPSAFGIVQQRVPSQQSLSEKVDGKSASLSRCSSESGRFVAASLPLAFGNIQRGVDSQQPSSEKVDSKSVSPHRGSSESSRFVAACLPLAIGKGRGYRHSHKA